MTDEKSSWRDLLPWILQLTIFVVASYLIAYLFVGPTYAFGAFFVALIFCAIRFMMARKRLRDGKRAIQPWSIVEKISLGLWVAVLVGGYLYGGLQYAAGAAFFM